MSEETNNNSENGTLPNQERRVQRQQHKCPTSPAASRKTRNQRRRKREQRQQQLCFFFAFVLPWFCSAPLPQVPHKKHPPRIRLGIRTRAKQTHGLLFLPGNGPGTFLDRPAPCRSSRNCSCSGGTPSGCSHPASRPAFRNRDTAWSSARSVRWCGRFLVCHG